MVEKIKKEQMKCKKKKMTQKDYLNPNRRHQLLTTSAKGITLIALIITIIVMLILVGVTISVAINGGLFANAKQAKTDTQKERDKEQTLSNGRVKIDGTWYDSMDAYITGTPSKDQPLVEYSEAGKNNGYLVENAIYKSDGYTATIPKGFKISEEKGEQEIGTGLVIQDSQDNEFVWIPLKEGENLKSKYKYQLDEEYNEPQIIYATENGDPYDTDTQGLLDYYYGTDYYTIFTKTSLTKEYAEMVKQVNKYRGFYIGRYETTIDGTSIGSKENKTVLSATSILKEGTNQRSNEPYYYRWYGLYYESKDADVVGNGTDIQTAMIYGQLWNRTMEFIREQKAIGKTTYDVDNETESWHTDPVIRNSGQQNPAKEGETGDVALNIWDLESNGAEYTQMGWSQMMRATFGRDTSASDLLNDIVASGPSDWECSRLIFYIKN